MAKNGIVTPYDDAGFPAAAVFCANWTYSTGSVAIKAQAGRLCRAVILTAFAGATTVVTFWDNATGAAAGTPLFSLAVASALNTPGQVFTLDLPAVNGISLVASGGTFSAGVIGIGYS